MLSRTISKNLINGIDFLYFLVGVNTVIRKKISSHISKPFSLLHRYNRFTKDNWAIFVILCDRGRIRRVALHVDYSCIESRSLQ